MHFCDNPKCQFHAVEAGNDCAFIERIKGPVVERVERVIYTMPSGPVNFCEVCHEAVQRVTIMSAEAVEPSLWTPGEKKLILQ